MHRIAFPLAMLGAVSALALPAVFAHPRKPTCEPGYKLIEVVEYKEVEKTVCVVVPDVKKVSKWVYSAKDDPFCIHKDGKKTWFCFCGKEGCPSCKGPYRRIQLVKKEIVEEIPTTKCVVEKVVELVPTKVCRKIPCSEPCPPRGNGRFRRRRAIGAGKGEGKGEGPTAKSVAQAIRRARQASRLASLARVPDWRCRPAADTNPKRERGTRAYVLLPPDRPSAAAPIARAPSHEPVATPTLRCFFLS